MDWGSDWHYDTDYISSDWFGDNEPFSYSMQTIEIVGQQLDPYWNFLALDVPYLEFTSVVNGGDNNGGSSDGCATGKQSVDWSVIEGFEGNTTTGYVPKNTGIPFPKSGVTVASGFDLGARDLQDLQRLGLSQALQTALSPYLGLKGQTAVDTLATTALTITALQATEINSASHSATLASLVVSYDKVAGEGSFYELPAAAQTVIASVSFQYGNLETKTPNFWTQVTTNDWSGAETNLRNFGDDFNTRRAAEADLLKAAMDAKTLNDGSGC